MKKNLPFAGFGCLVLLLVVATPTIVRSQTSLPPAAQEALDRGVIAAKLPDYPLAIRYFEEARKIAPEAPVIYFNLGLAESKMAGRELRAICWFAAYLAAEPQSPNAASVKEQVQILKIKSQSNVSHLITNLQDASVKIRHPLGEGLDGIAVMWAESGDIQTALKTATLADDSLRDGAYSGIAYAQAKAGDIPGALKTAGMIVRAASKGRAFLDIAAVQIENGDLAGAESSIAESKRAADLETDWSKANFLKAIGELQMKAGNMAGAQSTLKAAAAAVDLIRETTIDTYPNLRFEQKIQALSPIAEAQMAAGDIEGAKQTLLMAFKNSELITDPKERVVYQGMYILRYQASAGDIKNAMKTFQSLQKAYSQTSDNSIKILHNIDGSDGRQAIITAQIKVGDFAGALKMANEMTDAELKSYAFKNIAKGQVKAGDFVGMMKVVNEQADPKKRSEWLLSIVYSLADARDFDSATKVAEMIQDADSKGYATSYIADHRAKPTPTTPAPQASTPKPAPPPLTAKEWINELSSLEANYFTDLPGYLKTLPADDADKMYSELYKSVSKMIQEQNYITNALRRKTTEQLKP